MATAETDLLMEEMRQLRTDFGKISDTLINIAKQQTSEAAARANRAAEETWSDAKDMAKDVTKRIEEQPLKSTLIALAVGFLLGLIFSRR